MLRLLLGLLLLRLGLLLLLRLLLLICLRLILLLHMRLLKVREWPVHSRRTVSSYWRRHRRVEGVAIVVSFVRARLFDSMLVSVLFEACAPRDRDRSVVEVLDARLESSARCGFVARCPRVDRT